jgi:hypothetical protein
VVEGKLKIEGLILSVLQKKDSLNDQDLIEEILYFLAIRDLDKNKETSFKKLVYQTMESLKDSDLITLKCKKWAISIKGTVELSNKYSKNLDSEIQKIKKELKVDMEVTRTKGSTTLIVHEKVVPLTKDCFSQPCFGYWLPRTCGNCLVEDKCRYQSFLNALGLR